MFEWNTSYNIGQSTIDTQHQELFRQVNAIGTSVAAGSEDEEQLSSAVDQLVTYTKLHFEDEENAMQALGVDPRHIRTQQMEHHSFVYDLEKIRSLAVGETVNERYEKLFQFVLNWLVFHTLQTDQKLGVQLKAIAEGRSAAEAYDAAQAVNFGPAINRPVVDALVHLWTSAMETVHALEARNDTDP